MEREEEVEGEEEDNEQKGKAESEETRSREYRNVGRKKVKESKSIDRVNQQQASKQPK